MDYAAQSSGARHAAGEVCGGPQMMLSVAVGSQREPPHVDTINIDTDTDIDINRDSR